MRLTKIGLTGGIATGKSSVAELWRARGATIIDSDELAHQTFTPGSPTHQAVLARFGPGIRRADGTIDRGVLGEIIFNNAQDRQALNDIVHPVVRQMWTEALAAASGVAVVVIPLLFEVGVEKQFDSVVVTGCSHATQVARLTAKGLTPAQAEARIRAQLPVMLKMDRGNFVIWNDGGRGPLAAQAGMIWDQFKEK